MNVRNQGWLLLHKAFITLAIVSVTWFSGAAQTASSASSKGLTIKKVAVAEYRTGYLMSDSGFYSIGETGWFFYDFGPRAIVDVTGGFNILLAVDDHGYIWVSGVRDRSVTRFDTDSSGAPFSKNIAVFAYANAFTSIKSDGSLWYFGDDTLHFCHKTGGVKMRPIRISPPGMKVKKVAMGLYGICALTTNGEVWEYNRGLSGIKPVQRRLPGPAIDVFTSQFDYSGCLIPEAGSPKNMGYPWIWGTAYGFWGGTGPANEAIPLKDLWKMTAPVKEIEADFHTIHYIDSKGRLFGIGDNVMGEIGNGKELVTQYNYPGRYGWSFQRDEYLTGAPPIQIGKGIKWKKLFSNNFYAFYKYATDENDSLYFWGRDKALVSGRGFYNNQEARHPDALNVLVPTMVHPLQTWYQRYNFTLPTISAGEDQQVSGSTVTLNGKATPPLLIKAGIKAANGIDTVGYKIISYKWTKIKGGTANITNPDSPVTSVTGLKPGSYVFNLFTTDSNTGTQSASVTITVRP